MPVDAPRLTSRQHAIVRRFRQAAHGDADFVLLDGEHLVTEAIRASVPIDVLLSDGRWSDLEQQARNAGAEVYHATSGVIGAASPVRTPTGLVALARWKPVSIADAVSSGEHACVLGLVGVQDPGNVGSAIRAADALGATAVLSLDESADPSGWKALRGAMGSTFHLPVAAGSAADAIAEARRRGIAMVAAVATGGVPVEQADLAKPILILVGGEGAGLPPDIESKVDARVTIPMKRGVESLNVAVTAALLLFEARRQRAQRGTVS